MGSGGPLSGSTAHRILSRPALEAAPAILGWQVSRTTPEGTVSLVLTEVEAYMGEHDPASHAARGQTQRNAVMYGPAGHLYVYLSYGMHWCCNVVTGPNRAASAVLLRAGRVVAGHEAARLRRGDRVADVALARGPGCLGQALGISGADNGQDLLSGSYLRLDPRPITGERIESGHRVGIRLAHDRPWRFWIAGDPTVSTYRRSPRAHR
jgi:DNA-3-methyladenine glycosylase